ncbi:MAG: hypothetical protein AAF127_02295 [Pseudomonadota bacterium]
MAQDAATTVEALLSEALTRADRAIDGVPPVLGHMLASSGHSLINDAIVANVRGMLNDLARQLLAAEVETSGEPLHAPEAVDDLASALAADPQLLAHCHILALETHLAHRLKHRFAIDPVLSDLWQELIASDNALTGEIAMKALAAQSRFVQSQRRMQHPINELPAELLEQALRIWARSAPVTREAAIVAGASAIKAGYDESVTRIGLIGRLVAGMRSGAIAALELKHAGLALFASTLASLAGQGRARAVLACHEHQAVRLALSLRASGLDSEAIERQFHVLEPIERLPDDLAQISRERAADLLRQSNLTAQSAAQGLSAPLTLVQGGD